MRRFLQWTLKNVYCMVTIHAHRGVRGGIIPLLRVQKNVTGQRFLED